MDFPGYLEDLLYSHMKEIKISLVCEIQSFDQQEMTANVRPLYLAEGQQEQMLPYPVLSKIPVLHLRGGGGYYIRPQFQSGDLVWVLFSARNSESQLQGQAAPESKRLFDLSSAVVLGGIQKKGTPPPSRFASEGLLIGHEQDQSYIQLTDREINIVTANTLTLDAARVHVTGELEVDGNIQGNQDIIWNGNTTPTHAGTHTHPSAVPGSPSPPTAGS